jgi:hypothetical protein
MIDRICSSALLLVFIAGMFLVAFSGGSSNMYWSGVVLMATSGLLFLGAIAVQFFVAYYVMKMVVNALFGRPLDAR